MMALRNALNIAILAEDDDILAVSKPAGLVVHPAYRHPDGTLTDAVFADADSRGVPRPWLLHRLDRETSGVVLLARTEEARRNLVRQFEQRRIVKRYLAIIGGCLATNSGEIDAPALPRPTRPSARDRLASGQVRAAHAIKCSPSETAFRWRLPSH